MFAQQLCNTQNFTRIKSEVNCGKFGLHIESRYAYAQGNRIQDDVYDDGFKKKTVGEGFSMCLFEETHSQQMLVYECWSHLLFVKKKSKYIISTCMFSNNTHFPFLVNLCKTAM